VAAKVSQSTSNATHNWNIKMIMTMHYKGGAASKLAINAHQ